MRLDVSIEEIQNDAVYIFQNGFACSESVIYAMNKNFELGMTDSAIAMSSGFPWGLGGGGCICGALAGGVMCLGYIYGRNKPGDDAFFKCQELTKELHDYFKENCNGTCCRILTKGMEKNSPERKQHCIGIVKLTVKKLAEMILREEEG